MIKLTPVMLALLPFCFLSFISLGLAKTSDNSLNLKQFTFHDCNSSCAAKKSLDGLIKLRKSKESSKAFDACPQTLKGHITFKKINKRERGVCEFNDGSSVELKDIQFYIDGK